MEFNEDELENVVGGIPYDAAIEMAKEHPEFFKTDAREQSELTEAELDNVRAGYPHDLEEEYKPKTR